MKKTQDKEIFENFNISKKTWYNWKKEDNLKHKIYLALIYYWEQKKVIK